MIQETFLVIFLLDLLGSSVGLSFSPKIVGDAEVAGDLSYLRSIHVIMMKQWPVIQIGIIKYTLLVY